MGPICKDGNTNRSSMASQTNKQTAGCQWGFSKYSADQQQKGRDAEEETRGWTLKFG